MIKIKLICIKDCKSIPSLSYECNFRKNQIYTLIDIGKDFYYIEDDNFIDFIQGHNFMTLGEWREKQINSILNE